MENNYNNFDPLGENNNSQNEFHYKPEPQYYSTQSGYYYPKKKEKKSFSLGAVIAICLVCSIVAATISTSAFYYMSKNNAPIKNGSNTTNITVDKQSTNAVSAIAQKAVPSVVGIGVTASVNTFFGFFADSSSEGSGVVYSQDGYIITNYHVVSLADEYANSSTSGVINVFLSDSPDTPIPAQLVGYNSDYDLAVLKIEKTGLTPIEFADSNSVSVGDMAVAIGSPGGQQFMSSVSSGIISGLNRTLQLEGTAKMKLLQTDAAINPGNSGGALVDCYGKLIGINSSKISSEAYEGMGFAIPSNTVKKVVSNIINNKDKVYAYVGIKVSTDYTAQDLISMGYPAGAVVEEVTADSPADRIGIRSADIIVNFDGVAINDYEDYNTERLKHKPGETINITVYRNGKNYDAQLTLGESKN